MRCKKTEGAGFEGESGEGTLVYGTPSGTDSPTTEHARKKLSAEGKKLKIVTRKRDEGFPSGFWENP